MQSDHTRSLYVMSLLMPCHNGRNRSNICFHLSTSLCLPLSSSVALSVSAHHHPLPSTHRRRSTLNNVSELTIPPPIAIIDDLLLIEPLVISPSTSRRWWDWRHGRRQHLRLPINLLALPSNFPQTLAAFAPDILCHFNEFEDVLLHIQQSVQKGEE